ncbi:MAG: hypothetical protein M3P92_02810 [Actinomycetota bacterium]|nr:hypothetical protein [Actinomycetota bacterium]
MHKRKATTSGAGSAEHDDYRQGISVEGCGEFKVGTPKVQPVWTIIRYLFGMAGDVTVANRSTTSIYEIGVDPDRFWPLELEGPVVDEKAETLRAMELATRMG